MSKRLTTEQFIERAKKIHGDKYDYSKTDLNNRDEKGRVCITCPKHGSFWQFPNNHYKYGCKKCAIEKTSSNRVISQNEFLKRCKKAFGNKYDFSITEYTKMKEKVKVICPVHGEFEQYALALYRGVGCPRCTKTSNTEDFVIKSKKIHGNKYTYSKVNFISAKKHVIVTCPIHGDFKVTPNNHLRGRGCPNCSESHLETDIRVLLEENGIEYEQWKHFPWLGKQTIDFYLPKYNIGIECQGGQHFVNENFMGGISLITSRDIRKNELCKENKMKLIYYFNKKYEKYYKFDNPYFTIKDNLIKMIPQ
jgi:hypothetical protein